ncbi:MAG: FixH family protein [Reyranellaceae bacterium]
MDVIASPRRSIIPWLFPMGLALVVVVNLVLLLFALRSAPGFVVTNAYDRGRGYDAVIARIEAQDALGWRFDVRHDGGADRIVVHLADGKGGEISGLVVSAIADRPVGPVAAIDVPLAAAGPASYAGKFAPPARGAWDITVMARDAAGHEFRATRRVIVR